LEQKEQDTDALNATIAQIKQIAQLIKKAEKFRQPNIKNIMTEPTKYLRKIYIYTRKGK
jgi:hypothetical protein